MVSSSPDLGAADPIFRTQVCEYLEDFDTNGVFYQLGRRDDGTWENPAKVGRVAVYCEAGARGKELFAGECKEDLLERSVRGDASTCFALAESWFAVWLGEGTRLRPSHYTIRNGGGLTSVLTGWILEVRRPDSLVGALIKLRRPDSAPQARAATRVAVPARTRVQTRVRRMGVGVTAAGCVRTRA